MGISQFCQEHFAGNKTCSSRSEKKRKLKVLQKSFSSKNSAGHPDCYVTNQSRNVRQIFTFVAQSMETTPEKMFIFSEENMLSSKIFFGPLKICFKNSAKQLLALRQKWKNCWSKPDWKWNLILFQKVFFSQKNPWTFGLQIWSPRRKLRAKSP